MIHQLILGHRQESLPCRQQAGQLLDAILPQGRVSGRMDIGLLDRGIDPDRATLLQLALRCILQEKLMPSLTSRRRHSTDILRQRGGAGILPRLQPGKGVGRLVIVDLQGLSDDARQIIVALLSAEILNAATSKTDPIRPCFLVYEEGHNFAPAGGQSVSRAVIKKIAAEGRKFGVGFAIISQRPSELDPDVTSQCNTLITMRIKNPDDQPCVPDL